MRSIRFVLFVNLFFIFFDINGDAIEEKWISPLNKPLEIVAPFAKPKTQYSAGHRGFDLNATEGELVLAPTDGQILFVGKVVDRHVLTIETETGLLLSLEPVVSDYEVGEYVTQGDAIGLVDKGAHCSEKCVHLGVRDNGEYINPLRFFVKKPKLLPIN